jgi:hypothetical protein
MSEPIGHRRWAIAEGYIPRDDRATTRELASHEALCVLNAGEHVAHVSVTLFFTDAEPAGPYRFDVPARRTLHLRMNDFDPGRLPAGREYSSVIEASVPVVVQHTRLDSRLPGLALLSTMAFGMD